MPLPGRGRDASWAAPTTWIGRSEIRGEEVTGREPPRVPPKMKDDCYERSALGLLVGCMTGSLSGLCSSSFPKASRCPYRTLKYTGHGQWMGGLAQRALEHLNARVLFSGLIDGPIA